MQFWPLLKFFFHTVSGRQIVEEQIHSEIINEEENRKALKELQSSGGHAGLLDPGIDFPELTVGC